MRILLGHDRETGEEVRVPVGAFKTHFHLIGGTGKGKTTAIHTLLHPLLMEPREKACFVIIDRLGNLSNELLLWMSSRYCTDAVRRRLVYIQPSREDRTIGFNPLLYGDSEDEGYYKVRRATSVILRAWEDTNIEAMPRLARWTFNAFWAAAQLKLTVSDCVHFLLPGSDHHKRLIGCLPEQLRWEWNDILKTSPTEVSRILESTRNRLKPYFESGILRRMFGASESGLDMNRFMREARIVLVNLAPENRLDEQLGDAIGGLIINETLAAARSQTIPGAYPTYLLLDEFQNFVGPDIESALPEVRQLGIRLILSHQSFAQLQRGEHDLTTMIWQAQSRMIFGVAGEDASILGDELAALHFDPKRIKEETYVRRQRIARYEKILLESWSEAEKRGKSQSDTWGWDKGASDTWPRNVPNATTTHGRREGEKGGGGYSESEETSTSAGRAEHMHPVHEEYDELAGRVFFTPEEQRGEWGRKVQIGRAHV
jgi:hypothetical protein